MSKSIFPSTIIAQSVEVYDSHISVRSKVIYLLLLGMLVAAIIALPLTICRRGRAIQRDFPISYPA